MERSREDVITLKQSKIKPEDVAFGKRHASISGGKRESERSGSDAAKLRVWIGTPCGDLDVLDFNQTELNTLQSVLRQAVMGKRNREGWGESRAVGG